jgi:hypothetical protein
MRHEEKFTQSRQPYAVLPGLPEAQASGPGTVRVAVAAVWFRRRRGGRGGTGELRTVACAGWLWEIYGGTDHPPVTVREFCETVTDGRYGGDCQARWDGTELWAPGAGESRRAAYLDLLRPMLENYPAVPPGYEGWWTFRG